ncbi:hypothetical protein O6P43_021444 [Quillaja saponaria]|uniref:Uncharacterized protein n=1 Tax=Quillaja saponaria TaxID=32244 RepID=A0AAD7LAU3_QUISA|nr:hypothetical protein O6P43_021444 [Quillaja saponaria]
MKIPNREDFDTRGLIHPSDSSAMEPVPSPLSALPSSSTYNGLLKKESKSSIVRSNKRIFLALLQGKVLFFHCFLCEVPVTAYRVVIQLLDLELQEDTTFFFLVC